LETAVSLVREGANVTICARTEDTLKQAALHIQEQTGQEVLYMVADVTKEEDCQKVVTATVEKYGRLDILVNNAGTAQANPLFSLCHPSSS
jgi:3-oxoacyl-[acyl-carrier protein] reductase